jgi:hypothetical protein
MEGGNREKEKQRQPVEYEERHGRWLMNPGEVSLFLAFS